ncbi:MAG: LD-carboxypeptidase, partial [Betaproteobacteria bacterium]|nr:LD-carboxypeptidase [Betaproteobacteria bacterium]
MLFEIRRQITRAILLSATGSPLIPSIAATERSNDGKTRLSIAETVPSMILPSPIKSKRLHIGDTIGLVAPSHSIHERLPFEIAIDTLQAMGFRIKEGAHLRARRGHHAGSDQQRAADINQMFADAQVDGILAITGGSGANRILPLLDYELIRRKPKFFGGFSDITALINAIYAKTGLITFHSPAGVSEWNAFSQQQFRSIVQEALPWTMRNPRDPADLPAPREFRIQTLRAGKAQGHLVGGNLAVLSSMAGSGFLPQFKDAILFIEDTNEYIYRVDRMLSTLMLSGALDRLAGVVIGAFTQCTPGEGFGRSTLDEVFDDYFLERSYPVFRGAAIGHIRQKFTVPIGAKAEIDATE